MTNGTPEPLHDMTPLELAVFKSVAQELRDKYSAERDAWFKSLGRELNDNPQPGRPR